MLKWIALLLMLIDHFALTFSDFISEDIYLIMRSLGRISFPVFVYYVVLGLGRTSNLKRYMLRLLIFATLAEIIKRLFPFFIDPYLNVIFSLFLYGVFYLILENKLGKYKLDMVTRILTVGLLSFILPYFEYGYSGFILFLSLYLINKYVASDKKSTYAAAFISLSFVPSILLGGPVYQLVSGVAGIFMFNDKLNKRVFSPPVEKWTFYWAYSIQWLLLGLSLTYMMSLQ